MRYTEKDRPFLKFRQRNWLLGFWGKFYVASKMMSLSFEEEFVKPRHIARPISRPMPIGTEEARNFYLVDIFTTTMVDPPVPDLILLLDQKVLRRAF